MATNETDEIIACQFLIMETMYWRFEEGPTTFRGDNVFDQLKRG